ncbi:glycosyltransferase [Wenyingzhuangia aestuarii]|uniref:glycosyltransferase n=1 Tax=Wenyingzhuangia aestuarii TaxID=1647582 RepID=UPI00143B8955|nr:glycosyltransferase [Wenyingzhuangia aestuarii]NJB81741.1 glycosyltransferase involved in cell wall biosynthesis [Wenyingzhuangia aestuarii]
MVKDQLNTVSVFMLVYNQEQYIEQTILSVLNQKTSFPFNLVIGEDCSTDNTLRIIKTLKNKYPHKIKLLKSKNNIGLIHNFVRTVKECDGEYIAICDGDDYWIDEYKLQKQVKFLEENKDHSIVFTNKKNLFSDGNLIESKDEKPETSDFKDLIKGNYIASVTVLFRNKIRNLTIPEWFLKYPYGDWPLYLLIINDGSKIKYLNEYTAIYRTDIGVSSKLRKNISDITKVNLNILKDVYDDVFFSKRKASIKKSIIEHEIKLMTSLNREKKYGSSCYQYLQLIPKSNVIDLTNKYLYSLKLSIIRK